MALGPKAPPLQARIKEASVGDLPHPAPGSHSTPDFPGLPVTPACTVSGPTGTPGAIPFLPSQAPWSFGSLGGVGGGGWEGGMGGGVSGVTWDGGAQGLTNSGDPGSGSKASLLVPGPIPLNPGELRAGMATGARTAFGAPSGEGAHTHSASGNVQGGSLASWLGPPSMGAAEKADKWGQSAENAPRKP